MVETAAGTWPARFSARLMPTRPVTGAATDAVPTIAAVRERMWTQVGLIRDRAGLAAAVAAFKPTGGGWRPAAGRHRGTGAARRALHHGRWPVARAYLREESLAATTAAISRPATTLWGFRMAERRTP